ncbi:glycosyl hydrolase family 95 catalytic domain-containing protein [Paenibacillus shenyangensis]|uniref:glycosyl hydrolase family 95 catalytic domain-containing protein n=1 Tax=Paenibacillus sp. A9 TaxID=1284352 RepID=UPI00037338F3|nr:glycoside hydrolase N-terminal domain-containing protein [Paenibacillus sp. A9]
MNRNGYTLHRPASRWEDGMLCGNGTVGVIVMGEPERERLILSHEQLFIPMNRHERPIEMGGRLPDIRSLIAEGREDEAAELPVELFRQSHGGAYDLLWTDPFFPAVELTIHTRMPDIAVSGGVGDYARSLNYANGEAVVGFRLEGRSCERRVFVSRQDSVCVVRLNTEDTSADYELSLGLPQITQEGRDFYAEYFGMEPVFITHPQAYTDAAVCICEFGGTGSGYAAVATVASGDGKAVAGDGTLSIHSTGPVRVLLSLIPVEEIHSFSAQEEISRLRALPADYSELLLRHESVHKERYTRIDLRLDSDSYDLRTPEEAEAGTASRGDSDSRSDTGGSDESLWIEARASAEAPPAFLEKMFHAGRYETLSSCGEWPPNLQGVWAGSHNVPWCSDYTQDGNLPTVISGLLPSGDFESLLSYFDYQESMLDHYRENSRALYGCRGIHIPTRSSSTGYDIHFSPEYPMTFWTAGAAWASHFYYDYWLYTGDDTFFRDRALPFMREAALFYEDFLIEDGDGRWLFSPSYSPENTPLGRSNSTALNATMDIAAAKELLHHLITGCRTLGIEDDSLSKWTQMLAKMPDYRINADGALTEWASPLYEDRYDHRHASHLYMLYADIPEEIRRDPILYAACEQAYRLKRELKKNEQGTMSFGLVQTGMAAAHLRDAEMVEAMLQSMALNNYYVTFASSHDYGPTLFNADISGGVPALMLEAIAQASPRTDGHSVICGYEIRLLPAIPKSMRSGQVTGLRLRGGFSLDMTWQSGQVTDYRIHNPLEREYEVQ